jgi:hypothetical protein
MRRLKRTKKRRERTAKSEKWRRKKPNKTAKK